MTFSETSMDLTLVAVLLTNAPVKYRLHLPKLYSRIVPEKSHLKMFTSGSQDQTSKNELVVALAKASEGVKWPLLFKHVIQRSLTPKTINDYAFSNSLTTVSVYFTIPGIREVPKDNIIVRFRVRSFDFEIHDHNRVSAFHVWYNMPILKPSPFRTTASVNTRRTDLSCILCMV